MSCRILYIEADGDVSQAMSMVQAFANRNGHAITAEQPKALPAPEPKPSKESEAPPARCKPGPKPKRVDVDEDTGPIVVKGMRGAARQEILDWLPRHPDSTQAEICRGIGRSATSVSDHVGKLLAEGEIYMSSNNRYSIKR